MASRGEDWLRLAQEHPGQAAVRVLLKATEGIGHILKVCSVPGAEILLACATAMSKLVDLCFKLRKDRAEVGYVLLSDAFNQAMNSLASVEDRLKTQQETLDQILEMVTDIMYKKNIEYIEAAFKNLFFKGGHNLKQTLDALSNNIYELDTRNTMSLNIEKVHSFVDHTVRQKGKDKANELISYILTVKAEYLMIASLYYSYKGDHLRVDREHKDFYRDAAEIFKCLHKHKIYFGERNGIGQRHGQGTFFYRNGDRYEGNWWHSKRHGMGKHVWADGTTYEGDWSNDRQHGQGERIQANRDTYAGSWRRGDRHGKGKMTYANGDIYEGNWDSDNYHLEGMMIYAQGGYRCYDGQWRRGSRHGQGKMVYANGDTYEGNWYRGERHVVGKMVLANGNVYEGDWDRDVLQGKGRMVYANKDEYDGDWSKGIRHGVGRMIYPNGSVYEGGWNDDVRHGKGTMFYANKDQYDGDWNTGTRHGTGKMIYANGNVYEGDWNRDSRHGSGKMTYAIGRVYDGQWHKGMPQNRLNHFLCGILQYAPNIWASR